MTINSIYALALSISLSIFLSAHSAPSKFIRSGVNRKPLARKKILDSL